MKQLSDSGLVTDSVTLLFRIRPLIKLDADSVREALQPVANVIQERIGVDTALTWPTPNGDRDTSIAAASCADSDYRTYFTTNRGHVAPAANAFTLKKINIHERGTATPSAVPRAPCRNFLVARILVTDGDNRSALAATRSLGELGGTVFHGIRRSHPSLASISRTFGWVRCLRQSISRP